jgi:[acyl-carrier-protein] S-malonyltransferase
VRFDQTIRQMIASGITHFLEIGPGQVLSGFVRKIDDSVQVMNLDKADQLEKVKGWLHEHGFSE